MKSTKTHNSTSKNRMVDEPEFSGPLSFSDAELWEQFKLGNKKAFDEIYNKFFQPLCCYGDRICDNKSLVEDVVQDLFVYLWTEKDRLGKTDTIKFYLFCCLRRKLIRVLAREQRRGETFSFLEKDNFSFQLALKTNNLPAPEEEEVHVKLTLALNRLTDRQKEAIYLKFYNNLSFQEVASIMEIEIRSVYNLIGRTIEVLREDLKHTELSSAFLVTCLLLLFGLFRIF